MERRDPLSDDAGGAAWSISELTRAFGAFLGVHLLGAGLFAISLAAAGGGHGTYLPAKLAFPYAMLVGASTGTLGPAALAVTIAQFLVYAATAAAVAAGAWRPVWLARLAVLHALVATLALVLSSRTFP